jgi:hypothetical protein
MPTLCFKCAVRGRRWISAGLIAALHHSASPYSIGYPASAKKLMRSGRDGAYIPAHEAFSTLALFPFRCAANGGAGVCS